MLPDRWNNRARYGLASFLIGVIFPVVVRVGSGPHVALLSLPFAIAMVGLGAGFWFARNRRL